MSTAEELYYKRLSKPHKGRGSQQRHVEKFRLKKNQEVQSLVDNYIDFAKANLFESLSCTSFVDTGLYNNKILIKTRNYFVQHPIDAEYIESLKPYITSFNSAAEPAPIYAEIVKCPPLNDEKPIQITIFDQCARTTQCINASYGFSVSIDSTLSISLCSDDLCHYCRHWFHYQSFDYLKYSYSCIKGKFPDESGLASMTIHDFPPLHVGCLPTFGDDCIVILSPRAYSDGFSQSFRGKNRVYSTDHVAFGKQFIPTGSVLITDRHDVYLHAYRSRSYGIILCPPSDTSWCKSIRRYPGYHYIADKKLSLVLKIKSFCWECQHGNVHQFVEDQVLQPFDRLFGLLLHSEIGTNGQTVSNGRNAWFPP